MANRKIRVTQNDLDRAQREMSNACAVAQGYKSAGFLRPIVSIGVIKATDPKTGDRLTWATPLKVQEYIANFDAGIPVEPFVFDVRQPIHRKPKTSRRIARAGRLAATIEVTTVKRGNDPNGDRIHVTRVSNSGPVVRKVDRQFGMRNLRWNKELGRFQTALPTQPRETRDSLTRV